MQVDTDVFAALTERAAMAGDVAALAGEVAGLGRKITHLSGRVTIMTAILRRLDHGIAVLAHLAEFGLMLGRVRSGELPAPRHARPRRDRHGLHVAGGGRQ